MSLLLMNPIVPTFARNVRICAVFIETFVFVKQWKNQNSVCSVTLEQRYRLQTSSKDMKL